MHMLAVIYNLAEVILIVTASTSLCICSFASDRLQLDDQNGIYNGHFADEVSYHH